MQNKSYNFFGTTVTFVIVTSSTVLILFRSGVWSGDDGDVLCSWLPAGLSE